MTIALFVFVFANHACNIAKGIIDPGIDCSKQINNLENLLVKCIVEVAEEETVFFKGKSPKSISPTTNGTSRHGICHKCHKWHLCKKFWSQVNFSKTNAKNAYNCIDLIFSIVCQIVTIYAFFRVKLKISGISLGIPCLGTSPLNQNVEANEWTNALPLFSQ